MTNTRDIIIKLKEVRQEKGLSYSDILSLMEKNGDYLSKSTISRVFADGSEDSANTFRFEDTIRPIANALLDIDNIEVTDNMDVQAMKSLLKLKEQIIREKEQQNNDLESLIDKEKLKYHEKLDAEREQYRTRIAFLMEQINLKDKRMDQLLDAVFQKDKQLKDLMERVLLCQRCQERNSQ